MVRRLFLCLFALVPAVALAQPTPAETEARLRDLQRQIALDEDRLARAREAESVTAGTLADVERQIASREALVSTYDLRLDQLRIEQDSLARTVATLTNELLRLRAQYRVRATHLYKYGRLGDLALLFSARSFNEMVRRASVLRRFSDDGRRRYVTLERVAAALSQRQRRIAEAQQRQQRLLQEASGAQQNLRGLQAMRMGVVNQLRSQRAMLEAEVARKTEAARTFEREMRRTVTADAARRRASRTATSEAEYAALTGAFADLRGRLPWPVTGAVTEPYGNNRNPITNTVTPNPGILIATSPGESVRAVLGGTVAKVDMMPEYGTYVLVRHGEYLTVYGNLSLVGVRVGDTVRAGQTVGKAGTEDQPRGEALFFAVFHVDAENERSRTLNPLDWLRDE
ncbi:MAG TPA: peptidoglycan DD-metalloendopeptidase family protein [Rhodothermales bacterium]|nr:peptidoglycan DD-metalloendopeptidase family protein [Rhodothermales bacterium]